MFFQNVVYEHGMHTMQCTTPCWTASISQYLRIWYVCVFGVFSVFGVSSVFGVFVYLVYLCIWHVCAFSVFVYLV